jgi:hypothetical protein
MEEAYVRHFIVTSLASTNVNRPWHRASPTCFQPDKTVLEDSETIVVVCWAFVVSKKAAESICPKAVLRPSIMIIIPIITNNSTFPVRRLGVSFICP